MPPPLPKQSNEYAKLLVTPLHSAPVFSSFPVDPARKWFKIQARQEVIIAHTSLSNCTSKVPQQSITRKLLLNQMCTCDHFKSAGLCIYYHRSTNIVSAKVLPNGDLFTDAHYSSIPESTLCPCTPIWLHCSQQSALIKARLLLSLRYILPH